MYDKNCLATKQRDLILSVCGILVGVLGVLVGVLGVSGIGMVFLLHEMEHLVSGMVYLIFSSQTGRICVYIL